MESQESKQEYEQNAELLRVPHVKISTLDSDVCWWKDCIGQISPVLDYYQPTGFIKIRVAMTEPGFEDEPFCVEGWVPPHCVEYITSR